MSPTELAEKKADHKREEKLRKKALRAKVRRNTVQAGVALNQLFKPIEEWDNEELARGRPRDASGSFRGKTPAWLGPAVREEAVRRFHETSVGELRTTVPLALSTINTILTDVAVDEKGRPCIPWSVKADVAKWTIEHLVGKPTQRIEADISVKLQGILAHALVQPDGAAAIEVQGWDAEGEALDDEDELGAAD